MSKEIILDKIKLLLNISLLYPKFPLESWILPYCYSLLSPLKPGFSPHSYHKTVLTKTLISFVLLNPMDPLPQLQYPSYLIYLKHQIIPLSLKCPLLGLASGIHYSCYSSCLSGHSLSLHFWFFFLLPFNKHWYFSEFSPGIFSFHSTHTAWS